MQRREIGLERGPCGEGGRGREELQRRRVRRAAFPASGGGTAVDSTFTGKR